MKLVATNISKKFNGRSIFDNISFSLEEGEGLTIIGKNGSGKSTLIQIIAGMIAPSSGNISMVHHHLNHDTSHIIGLVAPYLFFYDNLTAVENISLRTKHDKPSFERAMHFFSELGIYEHRNTRVSSFSSGMLQRLRFIQAIATSPSFIFLDEPTTNLDEAGKESIWNIINSFVSQSVVIIATNEPNEFDYLKKKIYLSM